MLHIKTSVKKLFESQKCVILYMYVDCAMAVSSEQVQYRLSVCIVDDADMFMS